MIRELKMTTNAENVAEEILYLFETYGSGSYENQGISYASHMIQCAMLAMKEDTSDLPVIISALLHDIGYLLKHEQNTEAMGLYGVVGHESIGAAYLRMKGFSEHVCAIVEHHEAAKQYLLITDKAYRAKLSPANLQALQWQDEPMTLEETFAFEQNPYFDDIIKVVNWDEAARNKAVALIPAISFKKMLIDHLR